MTDPILPAPPASTDEAMTLANDLAYGFAKHTDPTYWARYPNDPEYFFRRMLGDGLPADSPDRALFGLYAFPPSPWHSIYAPGQPGDPSDGDGPPVDPPPVDPPTPDLTLLTVLARLDALDGKADTLRRDVQDVTAQLATLLTLAQGLTLPPLTGTMVKIGSKLTLKPSK